MSGSFTTAHALLEALEEVKRMKAQGYHPVVKWAKLAPSYEDDGGEAEIVYIEDYHGYEVYQNHTLRGGGRLLTPPSLFTLFSYAPRRCHLHVVWVGNSPNMGEAENT